MCMLQMNSMTFLAYAWLVHDLHGLILLLGSLILVMILLMEKYKNVMGPVGLHTLLTTCTFLYIHCIHSPIAICIAAG